MKYERFDPPTLSGVPSNPFLKPAAVAAAVSSVASGHRKLSPEMEKPQPLDLDLMSDLNEVIFNKQQQQNGSGPPAANRHVRGASALFCASSCFSYFALHTNLVLGYAWTQKRSPS